MKLIKSFFCLTLLAACTIHTFGQAGKHRQQNEGMSALEKGFKVTPDTIQTSVYWYWMSDNISKEGVVRDLKAMKTAGINRAFIGNIGYNSTPYGKVKLFSKQWWDILHLALKTAGELGIEIGIFNSPGWSQSGGPWIRPEQSMRYLTSSETLIKGGGRVNVLLEKPKPQFQDVRVVAFRAPEAYGSTLTDLRPVLTSKPELPQLQNLIDRDTSTAITITDANQVNIDFQTEREYTARSLTIYPAAYQMTASAELQIREAGGYRTIRSFEIDRRRNALNVGFDPYAAIVISFPASTSKHFRLVLKKSMLAGQSFPKYGIREFILSSVPRVERYVEKTFAKMVQTPLPYWNEYQWPQQLVVGDKNLLIEPKNVLDVSRFMSPDGNFNWDAPAGDWVIMRMGMTPTGVNNSPASREGTGLEVDKMSKEHLRSHFDSFLGEILRRIPAADRKTWKVVVQDSYETGGQNWTDGLIEKFKARYGYDPLPYLPALQGKVVGNPDMSDRFLWDLRRFIADKVAYDYVGGLREISHQNGLRTWLENYGHWGFPGEFLQYGGQSDEVAGEFWAAGELGNIENRAASSAAHIYGKTKVSAESFTAGGKPYIRYPAYIKQRGDRFFTEGINNTLLHVFIQQPDERMPGVNANFSTEFNRHNTWFNYLDLFTAYLKRCNFMLQQGKYVADVAYFIGEDAPKMTGITEPALPSGYSFDYINAEVIINRLSVKNGRLFLPDGMNYGLLVLPALETIRPELLEKIRNLVSQGAAVMGPAPKRSPSLEHYPLADQHVSAMAKELWGNINGTTITSRKYGKGQVLYGTDLSTALNRLNIVPDYKTNHTDSILFIHRTTPEAEIYYVSNQKNKPVSVLSEFRVGNKQPELWDPVDGTTRALPQYEHKNGITTIPLKLDKLQSTFIIFKKTARKVQHTGTLNNPEELTWATIEKPWKVTFDRKMRGPVQPVIFNELLDWTQHTNNEIRYYSGTAVYRNSVELKKATAAQHVYLNLGEVKVIAKVKVNGVDVGGAWTAPWRVEITKAIKPGLNTIEISVANTWVNRLIGDSMLPPEERNTWTNDNPYHPKSMLEPSGLKGPVFISVTKY
ncbi:glycosyl hydrolase [Pedobacter heparinus]|uniref:Glycoside hydrolase family 2 sugar binding n=1 Tax=Pedobacter heparinus (strain ATCC 13125 / DSM 2366 / CIP 104194 / JCM 7457 / NBRC 12017 / NCIMB 9290 / NRRL B-14731 / HIM 762-3) TaxID=485917 RepID=C6XVT9_PEDHD|nr:glycosyl hydrolase [Pedobacter heparinus]ACU06164.1 glycoside hydrolase family 2 sugar binding [Pedobacter heparinus DSM 2366]